MSPTSLLWNAFVLAGTVYLIVAHGWSPWWLLFISVFLLLFPQPRKDS